jgi:hypothetical protein
VEKVPDELYEALRRLARTHRKSIAGEVLSLLEENIATAGEIKARRELLQRVRRLRAQRPRLAGSFSSTEEMQREDRAR